MAPLSTVDMVYDLVKALRQETREGLQETNERLTSVEVRLSALEKPPPRISGKVWTAIGAIATGVAAWFLK